MSVESITTTETGYLIGVGVLAFVIIWVLAFLADNFRNRDMHISQYKFPGAIRYAKYDKETRKYIDILYANYDIHKQESILFLYVPLIFFFLIMFCGFMDEWSQNYPDKGVIEMCLWWMILSTIAFVVLICHRRVNMNYRDYVEYPYDLKEMIHCLYCGTWNYYGTQNCKSCGSPLSYKEYDTNNDDIIDEKDATDVGLVVNGKKWEDGVETWEGNHNINTKLWLTILILFILFVIVSNVIKHNKTIMPSEQAASSELTVSTQQDMLVTDDENMEQDKIESISGSTQYDIDVGGVSITLDLATAWDLYFGDSFVTGHPDEDTYISYMDSFISLGDKTNIQNEVTIIKEVWKTDVTVQEFACNSDNAYSFEWYSNGEKFIRIFEPVPGAKTYLEVEIEDYTGTQDSQTLIKTYATNFLKR